MIIKKYSCRRFAGLKDKELEFEGGLNVILGPNEAGKSTVIEGIHSVLFMKSRLMKRDSNFRDRFMPLPDGDSIDGTLIIDDNRKEYTLKKEWGESHSAEFIKPSGDVIKNEEEIEKELNSVLGFGQGTYSTLLFAKQNDIKRAIENIVRNEEETSEVSTLLRKTIMELDGVSVEKLGNRIEDEIKECLNNWDIERNTPKNGRGISNPYKREVGKILESFYNKESIKQNMDLANKAEDEFEKARVDLKFAEKEINDLKLKKESMEELEEDVTQRLVLEPKLESISKELDSLSIINEQWPQNKMRLVQLEEDINSINKLIEDLNLEKEQAKILLEKNFLNEILIKVDILIDDINLIKIEISKINPITEDDIDLLQNSYNEMVKTEAMINAGIIIGQLKYYNGESPLMIIKDLEEASPIDVDKEFRANGYIRLESKDLFQIELKTGDQDFNELRLDFEKHKRNFNGVLSKLNVSTIAEAKTNKDQLDLLNSKIKSNNDKIENFLGDYSYDELKEKIDAFGDLSFVRSIDTIESDIIKLNEKKLDKSSEKRLCDSNVSSWEKIYGDTSGLFNKVANIMFEKNRLNERLNSLKPLPEKFITSEDFRRELSEIRNKYDLKQENLKQLRENYYDCERELPDITYEELVSDYNLSIKEFNKNIDKGNKLLKIKEAFDTAREKADENSFTPLINTFSKYLEILTNGNYKSSYIEGALNIGISKADELIMPIDLLSSGTYDSVALSLRLSILEHILGDDKGFLILDDCLVDLDPERKEMAIKLINGFSLNHQVIFTTCSPDTAESLGGNIITM
ncbi:MAG: AAA family ATPase [Tissierellia bacterium]|nr:AAA family ATPase [Tissierellia bacterium]